jgi:hypothetical protein
MHLLHRLHLHCLHLVYIFTGLHLHFLLIKHHCSVQVTHRLTYIGIDITSHDNRPATLITNLFNHHINKLLRCAKKVSFLIFYHLHRNVVKISAPSTNCSQNDIFLSIIKYDVIVHMN